jgi:hypothetical protein
MIAQLMRTARYVLALLLYSSAALYAARCYVLTLI